MKTVIRIPKASDSKHIGEPLCLSCALEDDGWDTCHGYKPDDFDKIVYLGYCNTDGDMFAAYDSYGNIMIFSGELNSGTY